MTIHVDDSRPELASLPQRKLKKTFGRNQIALWRE
jgi:hypothetical protein